MPSENEKELVRGLIYDEPVSEDDTSEKTHENDSGGSWKLTHTATSTEGEKMFQMSFPPPVKETDVGIIHNFQYNLNIENNQNNKQVRNERVEETPYIPPIPHMASVDMSLQLSQQNMMLQETFNAFANQAEKFVKATEMFKERERRKVVGYSAIEDTNGLLWIRKHFDDGTTYSEPLVRNVCGPTKVYKLKRPDKKVAEAYAIFFEGSMKWVTGKIKKMSPENLYKSFIEAGVSMDCKYSSAQIGRALYELYASKIVHCANVITLEELGGWSHGTYIHCDNYPFREDYSLGELPVLQKKISNMPLTDEVIHAYATEIQSIRNDQDRAILAMYPYVSVLASLLEKAGKRNNIVVNIVPYEKIPLKKIGSWMFITERTQTAPLNADVSKCTLKKICGEVQDEVLFIDFRLSALETDHRKSKIEKNHAKVVEAYLGNYSLNTSLHPMGLVTISQSLYPGEHVCNILLGKDSLKKTERCSDVMPCIYAHFIKFVQENYEKVETIIGRRKDAYFTNSAVFDIVYEIVSMFWQSRGYSISSIMGLRIGRNDFARILQRGVFDTEDLIPSFIKAVRSEAKNLKFVEKNNNCRDERVVRFDDEWIWMSKELLHEICKAQGLEDYRKEILYALKKSGILKVDTDGLTRKLQIDGERKEFYQMSRPNFEKTGQVSLINMGKN